jgi:membrane peptidoglycan carboxypeptidase
MRKFSFRKFWKQIKPHPLLPWWRRWLQWGLIGLGGCIASGFMGVILILLIFSQGLPSVDVTELLQAQSTLIMDREGNILYAVHGEENREIISIDSISNYLTDATVAVEDDEFYDHYGFDLPCYVKAVGYEFFGIGIRRGCSTITQQLVKNIFLNPEQTYKRKIQELILAVRVESKYNKEEILELYLNEIPYGNNAYGAELAARTYFDAAAEDLTLAQSAIMASLPKAPSKYNPYGSNGYSYLTVELTEETITDRDIVTINDLKDDEYVRGLIGSNIELANGNTIYIPGRSDIVLNAMVEQGMVTQSAADLALTETWNMEFKPYRDNIKYPHFVLYVKELIEEKYGKEVVEKGGLKIYTSIDPVMQDYAEEAVEKYNERNITNYAASNASLVSIHPQTGQILAMVGSADYFNDEIDGQVNIATRPRQPGSSFKPFVYALSFLNGYSPATVLYDVQTQFGPGEYPQNYDGEFNGPISIRSALALSRNIPAIKAYFLAGKETEIIPFMENFGIDLDETIGYGWPLALGSGELPLIDLVGAYTVFANGGIKKEISPILKIENSDGEILEQWEDSPGVEALDPQVAYLITDILSDDNINLGPRMRVPGYSVAAKTGTSNKKDERGNNAPNNAWMVGYSPKITTGVWVGNSDGSALGYSASGYDSAGPIWNDYMTNALSELTPEPFSKPAEIVEMAVTKSSGLLPSSLTPEGQTVTEIFASFNVPTNIDDRWLTAMVDEMTEQLATEYSPEWSVQEKTFQIHTSIIPEYTYWQAGIDEWIEKTDDIDKTPTEDDDLHTATTLANAPTIIVMSPSAYGFIEPGQNTVDVEVSSPSGVEKVEFYLGDSLQFTDVSYPYSGSVRVASNATEGKNYEITAYVYDVYGYRGESTVSVQIGYDQTTTEDVIESTTEEAETE